MKKVILTSMLTLALTGCTTLGTRNRVVERADGLAQNPEWAQMSRSTFESEGKRYFVGYVEVDGDASKSAALNMSDEKAFSEPMKSMVDQFLDQNQVGEELMGSTGQRIISSTRGYRPAMPTLHIVKRYWEVVENRGYGEGGPTKSQLRVYSLAEVSIMEFERAQKTYATKLNGMSEVRQILNEVGAKQRSMTLAKQNEQQTQSEQPVEAKR